jgi:3-oxoadipate enol-lactonase
MPLHTTDDGCRIAFTLSGPPAAPALVLSNALGTDRGLWTAQIDELSRHFHVLTYDTRGHGVSDAPAGDCNLARLGHDVVSLMDHVGMDRAHVCGVSIGGITALWLGVHAPDRVHRLVLANTAARIGSIESWSERMRLVRTGGLDGLADVTMARWFTAAFRQAEPATVARMRATLLGVPMAGYLGCCAALRDADLQGEASRVAAPSLVVTGAHDVATSPAMGAWLATTIRGASQVQLEAAHLSNVECAAAFTAAVTEFLAD